MPLATVYSGAERNHMFGKLVDYVKAFFAVRALEKHPVYDAAIRHIRETFADDSKGLGRYATQKFREELVQRLLQEVAEVVTSVNPVMANREKLASYALGLAKYQVLILPAPNEPEQETTGFRGKPGITGELKAHLKEIAEKDKDIKEYAWSLGNPTPQQLFEACVFKCMVFGFEANLFHCTRIALGDYHPSPDKDWYLPFVAAMCAWEEHKFRKLIGLPDVLATQDEFGSIAGIKYSTFLNIVMGGAKYPNLEWEEHYKSERG